VLGRARLLLIYLLTGVLASLASLLWYPATVSVGASGAIFGLYGAFLALLLAGAFPGEFKKPFLVSTVVFVGYNLLFGFLAEGIDNAAHLGGLVSGLVAGYLIYPTLTTEEE
ncbi:MAG: rhomboid family intramembrane serine protease, partial [Cytophagales bacterium]|nr:rhomboid family intramembrane serine protease [Cytophagales bacterium]